MKNWINRLLENKLYSYLMIGYMIIQLSTLLFHSGILFLTYEIIFIAAILIAIIWIFKDYKTNRTLITVGLTIALNFIVNLILTIVYIPTLILNPKINWALENGGGESDPMILLAFFPGVHFIVASIIFLICGLICWLMIKK